VLLQSKEILLSQTKVSSALPPPISPFLALRSTCDFISARRCPYFLLKLSYDSSISIALSLRSIFVFQFVVVSSPLRLGDSALN
jgi:hypothetical protein